MDIFGNESYERLPWREEKAKQDEWMNGKRLKKYKTCQKNLEANKLIKIKQLIGEYNNGNN